MSYPANRNPMSSARRDHVHGRLRGADEPASAFALIRHGMGGGLFLLGLFAVATLLVAILFPAASSDAPRADGSNVRVTEAGAGKGPAR